MKKVAVFLGGSGYLDGSEIRESVGVLHALAAAGAEVNCFAPDQDQADVMDTLRSKPMDEKRNLLTEAARIARGQIEPLEQFSTDDFDAIVFPGGFGVAKNYCTVATAGANATVMPAIEKIIKDVHAAGKPIGAVCIAPALVGLALKDKKLNLTLGQAAEVSQEIEKLGHNHVVCEAKDCVVDTQNKLVTTPAYMYDDGKLDEIFVGIHRCIGEVLSLA